MLILTLKLENKIHAKEQKVSEDWQWGGVQWYMILGTFTLHSKTQTENLFTVKLK